MEGLGNLAKWELTGGQVHDSVKSDALLDAVATEAGGILKTVTADKAYDSRAFVEHVIALGALPVVPQLANRKTVRDVDWAHYKNRNLIERFFCRIKEFRRIATRYDKLAARFSAFIALAAAYIWLA